MELRIVATTSCGGGSCPTLYETDRGTFVVQGYRTSRLGRLLRRETTVEIPSELFDQFRRSVDPPLA